LENPSADDSKQEEVELSLNTEGSEAETRIETTDVTENVDAQSTNIETEDSTEAKYETSKDESETKSETTNTNVDSVPVELVQAANSIVDTILEKAKEVVIEKTSHVAEENTEKDTILENPSVEVIPDKPDEKILLETPLVEEEFHTEKEDELLESTSADAVIDTPKNLISETPAEEEILDLKDGDVEPKIVEKIEVNTEPESNEEPIDLKEPNLINETPNSDIIDNTIKAAEEKEKEQCDISAPVSAHLDIDKVVDKEHVQKTNESLENNKDLIEDIKKEVNSTFAEHEKIDKDVGNQDRIVTISTEKLSDLLENFPLGELALATLVIFFALIIFN